MYYKILNRTRHPHQTISQCAWFKTWVFKSESLYNSIKALRRWAHATESFAMRAFEMGNMVVVYKGDTWQHSISPCSKTAIPLLERNEKIVSWLRPTQGSVKDEIPAIFYQNQFYSLSLRMQKAIYRHIRLRKGFKNVEMMDGVKKLRIPEVLLREKIRTQSRFEVREYAP